jgi:putative ABC transport system permease protein
MESLIAGTTAEPRVQTRLLVVFSILALLLAAVGVYGVLAASVADRRQEIGIRIARRRQNDAGLDRPAASADPDGVRGNPRLAGAFAITRALAQMLFEITPTDATAFFGAGLLLVAAALVASLVPARRATAVDPMSVLRAE